MMRDSAVALAAYAISVAAGLWWPPSRNPLGIREGSGGSIAGLVFLFRIIIQRMPLGLTDSQLKVVMEFARALPLEKRDVYLQRIASMLQMRDRGHFNDSDVTDVAKLALTGLAHQPAV
jgi:hypothetical protein